MIALNVIPPCQTPYILMRVSNMLVSTHVKCISTYRILRIRCLLRWRTESPHIVPARKWDLEMFRFFMSRVNLPNLCVWRLWYLELISFSFRRNGEMHWGVLQSSTGWPLHFVYRRRRQWLSTRARCSFSTLCFQRKTRQPTAIYSSRPMSFWKGRDLWLSFFCVWSLFHFYRNSNNLQQKWSKRTRQKEQNWEQTCAINPGCRCLLRSGRYSTWMSHGL